MHTKGPWEIVIETEYDDWGDVLSTYISGIVDSGGSLIVTFEDDFGENMIANARLIAAAPELLDTVRDCVNFLADLNTTAPFDAQDMTDRAKSLHKRAYTAHSKAKGE